MAHSKSCNAKHDLVNNKALHISYCNCGLINLHMGPISLRISETAFAGFADSVNTAICRLRKLKDKEHHPMVTTMGDRDFVAG